jgi:hypothetical protein
MISLLDFLASNRSADDPTGGGLVSSNTHLDIPESDNNDDTCDDDNDDDNDDTCDDDNNNNDGYVNHDGDGIHNDDAVDG